MNGLSGKEETKRKTCDSCKALKGYDITDLKRNDLLKKVIKNQIRTYRLYDLILFLHKWRQKVLEEKQTQAIIIIQKYARSYLARKLLLSMKEDQMTKDIIYGKVKTIFGVIDSIKRKESLYISLDLIVRKSNISIKIRAAKKIVSTVMKISFDYFKIKCKGLFTKRLREVLEKNIPRTMTTKLHKRRMLRILKEHKAKNITIKDMKEFSKTININLRLAKIFNILKFKLLLDSFDKLKEFYLKKRHTEIVCKMKKNLISKYKCTPLRLRKEDRREWKYKGTKDFTAALIIQKAYKNWKFYKFVIAHKKDSSNLIAIDFQSKTRETLCIAI